MSVALHVPLKKTCGHHLQTSWCKVTPWQGHRGCEPLEWNVDTHICKDILKDSPIFALHSQKKIVTLIDVGEMKNNIWTCTVTHIEIDLLAWDVTKNARRWDARSLPWLGCTTGSRRAKIGARTADEAWGGSEKLLGWRWCKMGPATSYK